MIPEQFVIPTYDENGAVTGYNTRESLFVWLNDIVGKMSVANSDYLTIGKSEYWNLISDEKKIEIKQNFIAKLLEQKNQIDAVVSEIETI